MTGLLPVTRLAVTRLWPVTRSLSVTRLLAGLPAVTRLPAEATGLLAVRARLARLLGWDGHLRSLDVTECGEHHLVSTHGLASDAR